MTTANAGQGYIHQVGIVNGAIDRTPPLDANTQSSFGIIDPTNAVETSYGSVPLIVDPNSEFRVLVTCDQLRQQYGQGDGGANSVTETYDAAARLTATVNRTLDGQCQATTTTTAHAYDAENHELNADTGTWGPDEHPMGFFHFDGNDVLFVTTTDSAGTPRLDDIKIEKLGDYSPQFGQFVVTDRDFNGTMLSEHSNIGYNAINFGTTSWHTAPAPGQNLNGGSSSGSHTQPQPIIMVSSNGSPSPPLQVPQFGYLQMDGFNVGGSTIQGVRTQDNASGKWTTPDAYAGDVHDPMSQKPFMWNNNNPYVYADPTGYEACMPTTPLSCVPDALRAAGRIAGAIASRAAIPLTVISIVMRPTPLADGTLQKHDNDLPKDEHGAPKPSSENPHSQTGTAVGKDGVEYPVAREWANGGKGNTGPTNDIDWTDHGRADHTNPHHHPRSGPRQSSKREGPVPGLPHE